MTSLIMKIFIIPIGLILSAWIFPGISYGSYFEPVVVGVILALVGVLMEYVLLKEGTLWISTILDFIVSFALVYVISNMYRDAKVTILGAFLAAVLLAVVEYFTHLWLIRSGKTRKVPAA